MSTRASPFLYVCTNVSADIGLGHAQRQVCDQCVEAIGARGHACARVSTWMQMCVLTHFEAYVVMVYIVMAYVVMAYIVIAYVVMAYIVLA